MQFWGSGRSRDLVHEEVVEGVGFRVSGEMGFIKEMFCRVQRFKIWGLHDPNPHTPVDAADFNVWAGELFRFWGRM